MVQSVGLNNIAPSMNYVKFAQVCISTVGVPYEIKKWFYTQTTSFNPQPTVSD